MRLRTLSCIILACGILLWSGLGSQAQTAQFEFNGHKKDSNVSFNGLQCRISLNGNSNIGGIYELQKGTLIISANGESQLEIKGECDKVVIESLNGQSLVDLSKLKVGKSGVLIKDINGQSKLLLDSEGPIEVKSANGKSEIRFKKKASGPKLIRGSIKGDAKLIHEDK